MSFINKKGTKYNVLVQFPTQYKDKEVDDPLITLTTMLITKLDHIKFIKPLSS